jgi:hypothetical protein
MDLRTLLDFRNDILKDSLDGNDMLSESNFIESTLPYILDSKKIDNDDFTNVYYKALIGNQHCKVNGYSVNETGERLYLYIVNENELFSENNLIINRKEEYDSIFKQATNFINKSIKGHLRDIQDIGDVNVLINLLSSSYGLEKFDVIEVFLLSPTISAENRGNEGPQPKRFEFKEETIKVKFGEKQIEKEITIFKSLIDLNLLYNIYITKGGREELIINFKNDFNYPIEVIKAAEEDSFESYLCVLPATVLSKLYFKYSSRLLEKNVRSFLQFKGANKGMRNTLINTPEKFIAFNNGLTITASGIKVSCLNDKCYIDELTDFQIVNGGQTTASIYFTEKDGIDISKVKIMAKINVVTTASEEVLDELISNISLYSNTQTKVSSVDLKSRNPQIAKIKALSDSIITPSGHKWFFEKSKGEFNTKLKIAGTGAAKNRIEKEYPKEFRFTKEVLGKCYCSWGDEPHLVKKGGEAIFAKFISNITTDNEKKKISIDRFFYEMLISKIILFRGLEKIHGEKSNAIGQLRSAVVPYTISVLYTMTEGDKKNQNTFNFSKLWNSEGINNDLESYLKSLMTLINNLIKKYATSDDFGENSKKAELWDSIINSQEINNFRKSNDTLQILEKYSISKKDIEKKLSTIRFDVDFNQLIDSVEIISKSKSYYSTIRSKLWDVLSDNEKNKIDKIINCIQTYSDFDISLIDFEKNILDRINKDFPEVFREIKYTENLIYNNSLDYIIKKYNKALSESKDVYDEFMKTYEIANNKGIQYSNVFDTIGKSLKNGLAPSLKEIYYASFYVQSLKHI